MRQLVVLLPVILFFFALISLMVGFLTVVIKLAITARRTSNKKVLAKKVDK